MRARLQRVLAGERQIEARLVGLGRLRPVMRERSQLVGFDAARLVLFGHRAMQRAPLGGADALGRALAQFVVGEAIAPFDRGDEHVAAQELVDRVGEGLLVERAEPRQQLGVELAAEHRRGGDELEQRGVEAAEAARHDLAQRARQRQRFEPRRPVARVGRVIAGERPLPLRRATQDALGDGGAQVLVDEEGIALGAIGDEAHQLRRRVLDREDVADQHADGRSRRAARAPAA